MNERLQSNLVGTGVRYTALEREYPDEGGVGTIRAVFIGDKSLKFLVEDVDTHALIEVSSDRCRVIA